MKTDRSCFFFFTVCTTVFDNITRQYVRRRNYVFFSTFILSTEHGVAREKLVGGQKSAAIFGQVKRVEENDFVSIYLQYIIGFKII